MTASEVRIISERNLERTNENLNRSQPATTRRESNDECFHPSKERLAVVLRRTRPTLLNERLANYETWTQGLVGLEAWYVHVQHQPLRARRGTVKPGHTMPRKWKRE